MMVDKKLCAKCKYHGYFAYKGPSNVSEEFLHNHIMCDYSKYEKRTCLYDSNGVTVDRRGDDPSQCKLFVKGKPNIPKWCGG